MAVKKKAPVKKMPVKKTPVKPEPVTMIIDLSEDTKNFLSELFGQKPVKTKPPVEDIPAPVKKENPNLLTKIRETINSKASEGKTAKIVKLLGEFGVKNASTLPEEKYSEFLEQLEDL